MRDAVKVVSAGLVTGLRRVILCLLRGYQGLISPLLPAVFGPTYGCRFHPTCSHYALEAVQQRGVLLGLMLTVGRLGRCAPWHPGGFDPVPSGRPRGAGHRPAARRRCCVRGTG